jgi:hypothetical protein
MIHASVCAAYGFAIEELTEGRTLGRPLVKFLAAWALKQIKIMAERVGFEPG